MEETEEGFTVILPVRRNSKASREAFDRGGAGEEARDLGKETEPCEMVKSRDSMCSLADDAESWVLVDRATQLPAPEQVVNAFPFTYKDRFVDPDLLCWLCEQPATNVVRVNEAMAGGIPVECRGRIACLSCVELEFQLPTAQLLESKAVQIVEDEWVLRRLDQLPVLCPFSRYGCQVLTRRAELVQHTLQCEFLRYECIFQFAGCHFCCKEAAEMQVHIDDCPRQLFDAALADEEETRLCLTCHSRVPLEDIEQGTADRCTFHPGTWHDRTYAHVRAGTVGVLAFRVSDGMKTGVVIPLMAAAGTGAALAGGGVVLGACAALTAATAAGAVVAVPLVLTGALIMAPIQTLSFVARAAAQGLQSITESISSVAAQAADSTYYLLQNADVLGWRAWSQLVSTAAITNHLLLQTCSTIPALPVRSIDLLKNVSTNEEIMGYAPFRGCHPWSCCSRLGSFAEPCESRKRHTFAEDSGAERSTVLSL